MLTSHFPITQIWIIIANQFKVLTCTIIQYPDTSLGIGSQSDRPYAQHTLLVGTLVLIVLLPIGPSTRQHLVDAQYMERMETYPEVELVFAAVLHHVLVGTDAASLQSLTG